MLYTVNWFEMKPPTTTGKTRAGATLVSPDGTQVPDVTIWGDFPDFANIRPGSKIDGIIDYKLFKGKNYASIKSVNANGTYKPRTAKPDMVKAVEIKQQGIAIAQENKMLGIRDSSTFRAATDHVIQWRAERLAKGLNTTTEEWQAEWVNARKWFDARFSEPFN